MPARALTAATCSLRQAVAAAQSGDTIQLGGTEATPAAYQLTQGTDIETQQVAPAPGNGVASTTIDGSRNSGQNQFGAVARILRIDSGATMTIQDLSFAGGVDGTDETCSQGCSTIDANGGGDLYNAGGTVTVNRVAFRDSASSGTPLGGAISNGFGSLNLNDVSFTRDAAGVGGALFTRSGQVTANGVTFENDSTGAGFAGAVYVLGGSASLTNITAVSSSGLDGTAAIANSGGTLTLVNATMSDNGSDLSTDSGGQTNVENSILATGSNGEVACYPPSGSTT